MSIVDLEKLSEEDLLKIRICDLPVQIGGTPLEKNIQQLYKELSDKNIVFHPVCYLADEWMCPDEEPVIGIPFYLAHPRLTRLEKKMMLEAEGEGRHEFLQLLRHECGHAINYAYRFFEKREWNKIFGPFKKEYPDRYVPRPYSRRYVQHLESHYAQYHPDEDFAETFAVWLDPNSNWHEEYAKWPAIEKLLYIDHLMQSIAGKEPLNKAGRKYWRADKMKSRLQNFYQKKKRMFSEDLPGFYDPDLEKIFSSDRTFVKNENAARFLWRKKREITNAVARWTGRNKFVINNLLEILIISSGEQKLNLKYDEATTLVDVTVYITTRIMNYLFTGKFKGEPFKRIR